MRVLEMFLGVFTLLIHVLHRTPHGDYLNSCHGFLSISEISFVVLLMGHPSCRKLNLLKLTALEIYVAFLSNAWVTCGKYCVLPDTSVF